MNKAMYTVCGPILASFFFEMTINPNRLPKRPSTIIVGAKYVDEKVSKLKTIFSKNKKKNIRTIKSQIFKLRM